MTGAATLDIAGTRAELQQRRDVLTAQRPALALQAAGGDAAAIAEARAVAEELADLAVRLEGLTLAEDEVRRRAQVRQQQQAERARQERAEHVADLRARLGHALTEMEQILADLGEHVVAVDAVARELDQLESSATHPAFRRRYTAIRVTGRVRAALRCWAELPPVGQDPRPLGPGDVP